MRSPSLLGRRANIPLCALVILLLGYVTPFGLQAAPRDKARANAAAQIVTSSRVLIIAHRGFSAQAPENTLPSFRAALQTDADLIELDYYHSADNVPIVIHDKELDRTTNAIAEFGKKKIPVHARTWRDLQRLDAGLWFDERYRGTRIPSLVDALEVIQQGSTTLIERKEGDAETCVQLLRQHQLLSTVVVQAFDWEFVRACHELAPDLVLGALGGKPLTEQRLDEIQQTGAAFIGWNQKDLRRSDISNTHQRNLKVWAYTVDDPQRAQELVTWGVDGIITNDPPRITAALQAARSAR